MKKISHQIAVEMAERNIIETNLARLQPGDELGRRRVTKDAKIQARQLVGLVDQLAVLEGLKQTEQ